MNDLKTGMPPVADFVKTLLIVLVAEFAGCTVLNALRYRLAFSENGTLATAIGYTAFAALAFTVISNLATVVIAATNRDEAAFRRYADISMFLTASQTLLLLSICAFRGMIFNAVAAVLCLAALPLIALFAPGKFLIPLDPDN